MKNPCRAASHKEGRRKNVQHRPPHLQESKKLLQDGVSHQQDGKKTCRAASPLAGWLFRLAGQQKCVKD